MRLKDNKYLMTLCDILRFVPLAVNSILTMIYLVALIYVKTRHVYTGRDYDLLDFYHYNTGNIVFFIVFFTPIVFIFTRRKKFWIPTVLTGVLACFLHGFFYDSFRTW
jgi:hypothetical protein